MIQSYLGEVHSALSTISKNSSISKVRIENEKQKYTDSVSDFLYQIKTGLIETNHITISSLYVFDSGTIAIKDSYNLFDNIMQLIEDSFDSRLQDAKWNKFISMSISLVMLLILLYLIIAFYFSVVHTVSVLSQGAKQMVAGDLSIRLHLDTEDELKVVGYFADLYFTNFQKKKVITTKKQIDNQ